MEKAFIFNESHWSAFGKGLLRKRRIKKIDDTKNRKMGQKGKACGISKAVTEGREGETGEKEWGGDRSGHYLFSCIWAKKNTYLVYLPMNA